MGRPSEPIIDVAGVVEEALTMIDEGGMKALSMRGLGRRLGINPASLYHHFHNKAHLLESVRAEIFRRVKFPPRMASKPWNEQLLILGKTFRAILTKHPNAINLVAASNPVETRLMGHPLYEGVLKAMLAAGFDETQAAFMLTSVEILSTGSAMQEASLGRKLSYGPVDKERFPNLYRVGLAKHPTIENSFAPLLQDFIDGASARMLRKSPSNARAAKRQSSNSAES
ncbi:TetR family transcriptional regulator [Sphingopyxis terrae]|uniref:TetR family transcriptional regulator n=1 Tax=Sphingopyxis terrae TaxID=33052 RepID=UPI002A0C6B8A|nr:TetR family transcriptional regulator [Sphingopyxis terrae]MDX8356402.1 TetR family transcriptional regulator [Sphingopyxis terrae]